MEHSTDRTPALRPHRLATNGLGLFALAIAWTGCGTDRQRTDELDDRPSTSDGGPGFDAGPDAKQDAGPIDGSAAVDAPSDASTATVNGCTYGAAQNVTATMLTVTFPGLSYAPKCARIRAGQSATFTGSFSSHPLRAGTVVGGTATPDPGSRIASKSSGSTVTYSFPSAGTFPYYCDFHYGVGMTGVIYVDP